MRGHLQRGEHEGCTAGHRARGATGNAPSGSLVRRLHPAPGGRSRHPAAFPGGIMASWASVLRIPMALAQMPRETRKVPPPVPIDLAPCTRTTLGGKRTTTVSASTNYKGQPLTLTNTSTLSGHRARFAASDPIKFIECQTSANDCANNCSAAGGRVAATMAKAAPVRQRSRAAFPFLTLWITASKGTTIAADPPRRAFTDLVNDVLMPVLEACDAETPLTGIISEVLYGKKEPNKNTGTRHIPEK